METIEYLGAQIKRVSWSLLIVSLFCFSCHSAYCKQNITITAAIPAPNYSLVTDQNDLQQLTDNIASRYPFWRRLGSVGWSRRTPIILDIDLASESQRYFSGSLKIHTVKDTHAEILVPQRIDVYSRNSETTYRHVGQIQLSQKDFSDKTNHWIDIPISHVSSELTVVIHADGKNLVIDEISWFPLEEDSRISTGFEYDVADVFADSAKRLIKHFQGMDKKIRDIERQWVNHFTDSDRKVRAWSENCWNINSPYPTVRDIEKYKREPIKIIGYAGEIESTCVALSNPKPFPEYVTLTLSPSLSKSVWQFGYLNQVMAANGKEVFDPIIPLELTKEIVLASRRTTYLWLSFDLKSLDIGHSNSVLKINVRNSGRTIQLPISTTIMLMPSYQNLDFHVLTWSYTTDLPIWNNRKAAADDLVRHGVNVFTIPPAHIPRLMGNKSWDQDREILLKADLELFRDRGLILLYTGWEQGNNHTFFDAPSRKNREDHKKLLQRWLNRIKAIISEKKIKEGEWALYPVDEPAGNRFKLLNIISRLVHSIDKNIRLYANPTSFPGSLTTYSDLVELNDHISIWQPHLSLVESLPPKTFDTLLKPWWIYAGPTAPPKATDPILYYRLLSWRAWLVGAHGVGMWSYSDTGYWTYRDIQKSTAWSDFDGFYPDYAMVYESPNGPVSSRRWEAFRDGIEDFKLFMSYEKAIKTNKNKKIELQKEKLKHILDSDDAKSQFEQYRLGILQELAD